MLKQKKKFFIYCAYECYVYMYVHHMHALTAEARRGHLIPPETPVIDGCEILYGCWELNLGLLVEKPVLLTADLSLQSPEMVSRILC